MRAEKEYLKLLEINKINYIPRESAKSYRIPDGIEVPHGEVNKYEKQRKEREARPYPEKMKSRLP